ncbi:MAG TPA: VOC family protein [Thermoanaerobaculia bacterium]|nr:VOC family protein [Thermoanaerobaculia bacterium]
MELNHIHVYVRNLAPAVEWFERVCEARLTYRGDNMASLALGPLQLLLDSADEDGRITIGFSTKDCDAAFATLVGRRAAVIEPPTDRPYGVRAAYLPGPGAVTVELEQMLPRKT